MSGVLRIDSLEAEPGQRGTAVLCAPIGERTVPVPVIAVNGRHEGPRVAITGGIHGAEYVGIEAARRVGMTVDPDELRGSLVVAPIANTSAFFARAIYTSGMDTNNLNRMFPGDPGGTPSEELAHWLFQTIIRPSQYYIDMHGGDMIEALVPFVLHVLTGNDEVDERSRGMALATGIPRVIAGKTGGSTYGAAAAAGIPSILAEIGGQGVWSEDLVEQHAESTRNVLRHLGVLPGKAARADDQRSYQTFAWLRAEVDGLFYPTVAVGDDVEEGQAVGAIADYFGNELQRLVAPATGEVAFLVTSLAMNDGDPVLAVVGQR